MSAASNVSDPQAWTDHDKKIRPYLWRHRGVSWSRSAVGLGLLVWFLSSGRYKHLAWFINAATPIWALQVLTYFGVIAVVWEIIGFPFSLASWRIERQFGLSKQSFGSWLGDKIKGWILGAVLGAMALGLLLASVQLSEDWWWVIAASFFLFFSIVLAQLAPIILIPLFFKLKPMEAGSLKDRLLAICAKYQIEVKDVYHLGLGEKTEKGNAAFVGLGRTKRILIGDTMYEKYPPEQVEAVFGHELGHQVHNDIWKGIGLGMVFMYLSFGVAVWLHAAMATEEVFYAGMPYQLFVFFVLVSIVQMPLNVLQAMFSRHRERMADNFAADRLGAGAPLADALERLTFQNWGLFRPNALLEWLTYSHPAPWRRIKRLRGK